MEGLAGVREIKSERLELVGTISGSCPVAGFGISSNEPWGSLDSPSIYTCN